MRKNTFAFASLASLVLLSTRCGDNGLPNAAKPDMVVVPDLSAPPPDLTVPPPDLTVIEDMTSNYTPPVDADGIACGNKTCKGTQKCCVQAMGMMVSNTCADSCPDGNLTVNCDGPGNCGGNPCCASIKGLSPPKDVSCSPKKTDCVPMFDLASQSGQTRLCHADGDCTADAPNSQLKQCCTVNYNGQPTHLCLNSPDAALLKNFGVQASCP